MWLRIGRLPSRKRKTCRLYRIWMGMHGRCYRKTDTSYPYYGAQGVRVCEEWTDYAVFREWAIAAGYGPRMTIERGDHSDDYSPGTCRWLDVSRQQYNTRASIRLTDRGVTRSLPQWAKITGLHLGTLRSRVYCGWTAREVLHTPRGQRRKEYWSS